MKPSRHIDKLALLLLILVLAPLAYKRFVYISPEDALANFIKITEYDPLFVSLEFDSEEVRRSLLNFKAEQEGVMDLLKITEEITPVEFMESLTVLSEKQDLFQSAPSHETARELIRGYRFVNEIYSSKTLFLQEQLQLVYPSTVVQEFMYAGSSSSNQIINDDFELMLNNAKALDKEIDKREKILEGHKTYNFRAKIDKSAFEGDESIKRYPYTRLHSKTTNLYQEDIYYIDTSCFQPTGSVLPFGYYLYKKSNNETYLLPKIIGDNYYQRINSGIPREQELLNQGFEWRPLREGNSYRCNSLDYYGDLLTMRALLERYRANHFFEQNIDIRTDLNGDDQYFWDAGVKYESQYFQGKEHSKHDLQKLGTIYTYFANNGTIEDDDKRRELRERSLMINNKQVDLALIINSLFSYDDIRQRLVLGADSIRSSNLDYLYTVRSNYSFIFLNFSKAVWRIPEQPKYLGNFVDKGAYSNRQELEKKYTIEQINKFDSVSEGDILNNF